MFLKVRFTTTVSKKDSSWIFLTRESPMKWGRTGFFWILPLSFFLLESYGAGCFPPSGKEQIRMTRTGQRWGGVDCLIKHLDGGRRSRSFVFGTRFGGASCEITSLTDSVKNNVAPRCRCILRWNIWIFWMFHNYHVSFVVEQNGRVASLCIIGIHGLPWKHLRDPQGMYDLFDASIAIGDVCCIQDGPLLVMNLVTTLTRGLMIWWLGL